MKRTWPISLEIPAQNDHKNPDVLHNVKELQAWLHELPLLRLDITLEALLESVSLLNQEELPCKTRLKLLNCIRQTLLTIYPTSEMKTLKRLPVKVADHTRTRDRMGELCQLLAGGYKIILKETYEAGDEPTASPVMLSALYHAMEMLSLTLLNCFRCYRSIPPKLFREIYLLYQVTHQGEALELELESNSGVQHSIDALFLQILTLSSMDPFHLPQDTALPLYELLRGYSAFVQLKVVDADDQEHACVLDLNSDQAPQLVSRNTDKPRSGKILILDKQGLGKKIQADITQLQGEKEKPDAETRDHIQLLQMLIPEDPEQRIRKSNRQDVTRETKVIFGIEEIHRFLSLEDNQSSIVLQAGTNDFDGLNIEKWTIQNESMTGYLLSHPNAASKDIRVGDLLAIYHPESDRNARNARIAVIKWMKHDEQYEVQIGVELIAGDLAPVTCRIAEKDSGQGSSYYGLLISEVPALKQSATLVVPKKLYYRGRTIEIDNGFESRTLRAGFIVEDSFSFDRFDFSGIED